jgi:hypothetical protein
MPQSNKKAPGAKTRKSGPVPANKKVGVQAQEPRNDAAEARYNAPHEPTKTTRALVEMGLSGGFTQEQIGRVLGISDKTLRKYYAPEIADGGSTADLRVAGNLFRIATQTSDNKAALTAGIFWLKARRRWRTTDAVEVEAEGKQTSADGEQTVSFTLKIGEREAE